LEVSSLLSNLSHHHYSSSGRRLLHYTMDELFYPRLYLTVQPAQPHVLNGVPNFSSKYLRIITGTAPTLLSLILLFLLISLGSEIQQMKRSLEACSTTMGLGWEDTSEPLTITTTVHASSNTKWWFGEVPITPSPPSATPSRSANLWSPHTSPAYLTSAQTSASKSTSSADELNSGSRTESSDLALIIEWPFDSFNLPLAAQVAIEKVIDGLGAIWRVFRRVYHYPLDPPS
jgi:hypothetical protein